MTVHRAAPVGRTTSDEGRRAAANSGEQEVTSSRRKGKRMTNNIQPFSSAPPLLWNLQVLSNPEGTPVHTFCCAYNLADMPPNTRVCKTNQFCDMCSHHLHCKLEVECRNPSCSVFLPSCETKLTFPAFSHLNPCFTQRCSKYLSSSPREAHPLRCPPSPLPHTLVSAADICAPEDRTACPSRTLLARASTSAGSAPCSIQQGGQEGDRGHASG